MSWFGADKPRAIVAMVKPTRRSSNCRPIRSGGCGASAWSRRSRKYTPHVTLARLRSASPYAVADYLSVARLFSRRSIRGRRASFCFRRANRPAAAPISSRRRIALRESDESMNDEDRRRTALRVARSARSRLFQRSLSRLSRHSRGGAGVFLGAIRILVLRRATRKCRRCCATGASGARFFICASRQELGWSEPPAHLRPFLDVERHSLAGTWSRPNTRVCAISSIAPSYRGRSSASRRASRALANELIDRFEGEGEVDLLEHFATPIPVIVIAELLGVPGEMWPRLLDWSHRMVAMYQFGVTRAVEDGAVGGDARVRRVSARLCRGAARRADRRSHQPADRRPRADDGRLSEDELIATCILVLNAGHEATVHALGNGVKAMLEARDRSAPGLCDAGGDRGDGRGIAALRRAASSFHPLCAAGCRISRASRSGRATGSACCWAPPIAIPSAFADPDRIDASRAPNPHVAFGGGIHFCLGAPLARLEMEIALPILVPASAARSGSRRGPPIATAIIFTAWRRCPCAW